MFKLTPSIKYFILLWLLCRFEVVQGQSRLSLWYNEPASDWMTEALPLGNGYMGVMFFGGIESEQLQFTEGSLWSGGPKSSEDYNYGNKPGSWKYLDEVRSLIRKGNLEEANELVKKHFTGVAPRPTDGNSAWGDYGAQQTMGDLFISLDHGTENISDYKRELDISTAVGSVRYKVGATEYRREYFGSNPNGTMVYKFSSDRPTQYIIHLQTPHVVDKEEYSGGIWRVNAHVNDNKQGFQMAFKVITDGNESYKKGKLTIEDAQYIIVYHTAATSYTLDYPLYAGNDYNAIVASRLNKIAELSYEEILEQHIQDYQDLFYRVSVSLSDEKPRQLPTDQRQREYFKGAEDFAFEELYFQYGRYLMIAASRPGGMPMNLQGKWNNSVDPPWAADYHMNINQQMLYWPAEVTNLAECHEPLLDYIESLIEPGTQSAKDFFNTRGWVVNTMNNAYGYTAPGWDVPWGFFPGGAAWLAQHLWDHFEFGLDTAYLKDRAYPIMKAASQFWIDYLIEDEDGFLVSSPSYSPEHGGISGGASMDHQIAWDVLNNSIQAGKILNDHEFVKEAEAVRSKILPLQIGRWGQLQEWKEDVDDPTSRHRHVSHLFALHPGRQISLSETPHLAKAARVTLEARGDDATGWSLAWKVNFWARLKNGDRAYKLYKMIMKPSGAGGSGSGSYPNLLAAHPPFQLDGNMGATAGMAEMLLQSQTDEIMILPALPAAWSKGYIKGLRARGGYTIDIYWEDSELKKLVVKADEAGDCKLSYLNLDITVPMAANSRVEIELRDFVNSK